MLYGYGHDLDPTAPIRLEPFTPAILGTKQIANFAIASHPRGATWLIALFAAVVIGLALWHLVRAPRPRAAD
jgi:hypothetical protein